MCYIKLSNIKSRFFKTFFLQCISSKNAIKFLSTSFVVSKSFETWDLMKSYEKLWKHERVSFCRGRSSGKKWNKIKRFAKLICEYIQHLRVSSTPYNIYRSFENIVLVVESEKTYSFHIVLICFLLNLLLIPFLSIRRL